MKKNIRLILAITVLIILPLYDYITDNKVLRHLVLSILFCLCIVSIIHVIKNKENMLQTNRALYVSVILFPTITAFFIGWLIIWN